MIEFFTDRNGEPMYKEVDQPIKDLADNKELISELLMMSKNFYPEQYEALNKEYEKSTFNKPLFDFLRARRIVNCCFG